MYTLIKYLFGICLTDPDVIYQTRGVFTLISSIENSLRCLDTVLKQFVFTGETG